MREDVRRDLADSVFDFERLVAPELEQFLGGPIEILEERSDQTARRFDIDAGFDAICRTPAGIITLANRVQWLKAPPGRRRR
jgi:hypothetical protein